MSRPLILARSLIFNALFYLNLLAHMLVALPTLLLPYPALRVFIRSYARTSLWLLRVVCGTRVTWRGTANIAPGACIVACKHQSAWETFALYAVLEDPIYVLKGELMWIPLFGWYLWKSNMIPVDRRARGGAMAGMIERARAELARGRQIIIFPEGTRTAPGAPPAYRHGLVNLYMATGVPCLPVALNSGLFWPRRKFLRYPGTIVLQVLDPIPPGLPREEFAARLEREIETATARLIAEGQRELCART